MAADKEIFKQVLELIPQQRPFRFIDHIIAADEKTITATYRFRDDETFYAGHFPQNPITPGVILIETMAQTGVVAMGIFQLLRKGVSVAELQKTTSLFSLADNIEFTGMVFPGEKVIIAGELIYFRKNNIKAKTTITRENGEVVCSGILSGAGVRKE